MAFSFIELDFQKATPLIVIAGAGVGAWLLVRYISQQNAASAQDATLNEAGAATDQYLGTLEQEAELSAVLGDPGGFGSTGSSATTGVTYSGGSQNVPPATNTTAIGGSTGSAIGNPAPSGLYLSTPPGEG